MLVGVFLRGHFLTDFGTLNVIVTLRGRGLAQDVIKFYLSNSDEPTAGSGGDVWQLVGHSVIDC